MLPMSQPKHKPRRILAVNHAVQILDCFLGGQKILRLGEIAVALGLNKSSVYRLLETLVSSGLLTKDPFHPGYTLGIKVVQLAQSLGSPFSLTETAVPLLQRLRDQTGETAALHIRIGTERLCVVQMPSSQPVRLMLKVDFPYPLVRGAAGKAFLAYLPAANIGELLADLEPSTRQALARELPAICKKGFAVSRSEVFADAIAICSAVLSRTGQPIATLGIHGPAYRISDAAIPKLGKRVLAVATELSEMLSR